MTKRKLYLSIKNRKAHGNDISNGLLEAIADVHPSRKYYITISKQLEFNTLQREIIHKHSGQLAVITSSGHFSKFTPRTGSAMFRKIQKEPKN